METIRTITIIATLGALLSSCDDLINIPPSGAGHSSSSYGSDTYGPYDLHYFKYKGNNSSYDSEDSSSSDTNWSGGSYDLSPFRFKRAR